MKKRFRILAAALTLAVCLLGGVSASAAVAAVPADKSPRDVVEPTGAAKLSRDTLAYASHFGGPYRFADAPVKRPADDRDAAPAEDAVATLTIYVQTDVDTEPINFTGHSFLGIENISDHELEVGGLLIAPGTGVTIGTRANRPEHAGIWYNLEGFYCYYLPSFYPNLYSMRVSLDQAALDTVNQNITLADHWSAFYNCTSFTTSMWNAVCTDTLSAGTPNSPKGLKANIRTHGDKFSYNAPVPYDYIVTYGLSAIPSEDYS